MLFWTVVKVAWRSLFTHKLRTFLAMLGIIIGVGAVISMLALGTGAQKQVLSRVTSMGTDLLVVRPGQKGSHGVNVGTQETLKPEDALAIIKEIPEVFQVSPVVNSNAQLKYFNKNTRTTILGVAGTYFSIRNFEIKSGRAFTDGEVERQARVAVIGPVTAESLFGVHDPLGKTFKLNGINFRVVGILKSKGDQGWFNPDDQVLIPYSTAMQQVFGLKALREINIQAQAGWDLNQLEERVTKLLRERHRIPDDLPEDFDVRNQTEILEMASSFTRTFTILLGGIALISLLVGGIGIMNVMLISVTERTREIGIRKAIGAKERDILGQFLLESLVMSSVGGALGMALGIGIAQIIPRVTEFLTVVTFSSIVLAVLFSVSVGLFFGYYPAWRAARLNPIEALRHE